MDDLLDRIKNEVKEIINHSNLSNITPKSIRSTLEEKFKTDLSEKKNEINEIIVQELSIKTSSAAAAQHSDDSSSSSSDDDDELVDHVPPKKKQKLSDEELARKIQAEENIRSKRSTTTKATAKRKKAATTAPSNGGANKKSAFQKDCYLSQPLSEIIGKEKCPRSEVVKSMWKYFKDNSLMDPQNKQFVVCDEKLSVIFGKKKFKAFGMMKDLKRHIFDEPVVAAAGDN